MQHDESREEEKKGVLDGETEIEVKGKAILQRETNSSQETFIEAEENEMICNIYY